MAQRPHDFPLGTLHFQEADSRILDTRLGFADWFPAIVPQGLPIAVIGELIVTGEGNQHPKPNAKGEAHLGGSIDPHLSQPEMGEQEEDD